MKPLLQTVVAVCLLLATHAHPENIEEVKELPQSKEPVIEAEETEPQARVERCTSCSPANLNLSGKSPKEIVAALQSLPAGEVHTQQSFEGCSSSKGCAGIKLQDGKVTEKFGNIKAFGGENAFQAGSAYGSKVLSGKTSGEPFWWMDSNSPFKNVNSESYVSKSSSSFSSGSGFQSTNGGAIDVANNPFLNGNIGQSGYQASQGQGFATSQSNGNTFYAGNAGNAFQSGFGAGSQSAYPGSAGVGYTGSSPSPFTPSTGSNVNLIQNTQKVNEYDFDQTQQSVNDEIFRETSNFNIQEQSGGALQQTCADQGYACVLKSQCSNGVVNTNGAGILQARVKKQYCNTLTEVCCRLEQSSLGVGFATTDTETQGSGLVANTVSGQTTGSYGSFGAQGSAFGGQSSYDANRATSGSGFVSTVPAVTAVPVGSTGAYGSTLRPGGFKATGQNNFVETDAFSSQSQNTNVFRPGSVGSNLKPGVPYLPPVDNTNSGTNIVSSTVYPSTFITTPRPVITPRPVSPPRPITPVRPVTTPRPYTTPRPTYLPPVPSTAAPGYLPPVGEQSINRETFVPSPNYNEGGIILDETRQPSTTRRPFVPVTNDIPAGCAAALKCTPIEFCTADGIISNTSVILTRDQDAYRVPLTDCKDLATGRIGKCCRDPFYTDPWPTNQLGRWVPGVFGGNDGKYVPDSRGSASVPGTQFTARPDVTGSTILNNFRTPKPTTPTYGTNKVTAIYQGQGQFTKGGVGQFRKGGIGQVTQTGIGQKGVGQIGQAGVGQFGQIGVGQISKAGVGQVVQTGVGQIGQVGVGQFGQVGVGQFGQTGVGQFGKVGVGQLGQTGVGQVSQTGFGVTGQSGEGKIVQTGIGQVGQFGVGQAGQYGVGQVEQVGVGQAGQYGVGQVGQVGVGQTVQYGEGQVGQVGVGQAGQYGVGQVAQVGAGEAGQYGEGQVSQVGVGQAGQYGEGQVSQVGVGQAGQYGEGQVGQVGVGQTVQTGVGQIGQFGVGQVGQFGVGKKAVSSTGQIGQTGSGQIEQAGIGQIGQGGIEQISQGGVGQYTQGGVGQYTQGGIGQYTQGGRGQYTQTGIGQYTQTGIGQYTQGGRGQIIGQGEGQIGIQEQGIGISQGGGAIISQGQGQYVKQGLGQRKKFGLVSQGITQLVEGGEGQYTEQGVGQTVEQGVGEAVIQGGGVGISQGVGYAVSQGVGSTVENEYSASTRRIYLQRYNGTGQCGVKHGQRPYGNHDDLEVDFAEIPWQAMVLLQTNRSLLCGGVISRPDVVITSAACVDGLEAKNVLVKGGEWKLGIDDEPLPFQIVQVKTIIFHPGYQPGSLQNDVAILYLAENLRLANNIQPICMPDAKDTLDEFYSGAGECIVTGWGKQVLQAHLAGSIMHSVNVSLIEPTQCEAKIQQDYPHLLDNYDQESCVCGQPANPLNNICRVDIGSALACSTGDGYFVLKGVYSWDSGCQTGNQLAAFYKFDIEWYEWAIGVSESVRYTQYGRGTKITQTRYTGQITSGSKGTQYTSGVKGIVTGGVKGFGAVGQGTQYTQFGAGQVDKGQAEVSTGQAQLVTGQAEIGSGQFDTSRIFGQGQISSANFSQFSTSGKGQLTTGTAGAFSQFGTGSADYSTGNLNLGSDVNGPISNTYSSTYTEKKFFKTEPQYITYTTKPEIVTFTTKPEIVTYTTKPEIFTYTTKPKIITYTTKPKIITYTTKPKIITYTTQPKIITYTTKPQIITYETSGSGTNPQYVAPGVSFNPSFSELVGKQHKHDAQCKCHENGKK